MKEFRLEKVVMGYSIIVNALLFKEGINISLVGGSLPHIGAISIISPNGDISTTVFEEHKDYIISEKWANILLDKKIKSTVISVGIHYDNITKSEINNILFVTNKMLEELLILIGGNENV